MILLSLVGEQPIPTLLPLWQAPGRYSAVQFAATQTTLPAAHEIAAALLVDPALRHIQVLEPLLLDAYGVGATRARLAQAFLQHLAGNRGLELNITGGTKLMSMAAMQAVYGTGIPLLYVSTETNQLLHFASDGSETGREPIAVRIGVEQYLIPHGLEVSDNLGFRPGGAYSDIRPEKEGDRLEEKVFTLACQSGFFEDVRRGVFIRKLVREDYVVNELDVVATHNGRMVVCSCKSGKIDNDDLYELSSLSRREAAGIYCGKVLVSGQVDLPAALKKRAAAFGIRLVYGNSLERAAEQLRAAVDPPRPKDKPA